MPGTLVLALGGMTLMGCAPVAGTQNPIATSQTRMLAPGLAQITLIADTATDPEALRAAARCEAVRFGARQGYGFARHLRTTLDEMGGQRRVDAVYTVSSTPPDGLSIIDIATEIAACDENGIPLA